MLDGGVERGDKAEDVSQHVGQLQTDGFAHLGGQNEMHLEGRNERLLAGGVGKEGPHAPYRVVPTGRLRRGGFNQEALDALEDQLGSLQAPRRRSLLHNVTHRLLTILTKRQSMPYVHLY